MLARTLLNRLLKLTIHICLHFEIERKLLLSTLKSITKNKLFNYFKFCCTTLPPLRLYGIYLIPDIVFKVVSELPVA